MAGNRTLKHGSHDSFRGAMRVVGPILIVIGAVMFVAGILSFFSKFEEKPSPWFEQVEPREPNRFWMCFVGMPVAVAGVFCTRVGFLGAAARYVAGETAPVARDTINYVLDGTKESIGDVAGAIRAGGAAAARCPKCDDANDADASFCSNCGTALAPTCPKCGEANDADARFCDACGEPIASDG